MLITLKRHLLVVTDAPQQALPDGRIIPSRFFKSFSASISKGAHPLRSQNSILAIDLLAVLTALQVSPQFGQLNLRQTARSRQSTTLLENILLVRVTPNL